MPLDPAVEQAIRARLSSSEFANWMGMEFISFGEGECEVRLKIQSHHLNPSGIVHGGVIATVLDGSIGLALRTKLGPGSRHVTVHLDVQYLAMVKGGSITAKGQLVHAGSRSAYGESSLYDDEGRLIAKGAATFLVIG